MELKWGDKCFLFLTEGCSKHSILEDFLFSLSLFFYLVTLTSKLCNVLKTPLLSILFSLCFKNGFQTDKQYEITIQVNQYPDNVCYYQKTCSLFYLAQSTILCSLVFLSFFRHHGLKQCQGLLVTFFKMFVKFLYSQVKQTFYSIHFDLYLLSSHVKHTPQYSINEFIIRKLNP